jgi:hypothetical protein
MSGYLKIHPGGDFSYWLAEPIRCRVHHSPRGCQIPESPYPRKEGKPNLDAELFLLKYWLEQYSCYEEKPANYRVLPWIAAKIEDSVRRVEKAQTHSDSRKTRRGARGITSHGKRKIRDAGKCFASLVPSSRTSFFTATIPNLGRKAVVGIQREWSQVVRRFLQSIRRALKASGLPLYYFGCTELQEKRSRSDGVLYPHLHLCFPGRHERGGWILSPSELDELWFRALRYAVPDLSREDMGSSCNVQRVQKSVEGYMAKYLSKGIFELPEVESGETELEQFHPTAWHHCSRELSRVVTRNIKVYSFPIGSVCEFFNAVGAMVSSKKVVYAKTFSVDEGSRPLACYGRVRNPYKKDLYSVASLVASERPPSLDDWLPF